MQIQSGSITSKNSSSSSRVIGVSEIATSRFGCRNMIGLFW
jgi:hypothetical protein